MGRKKNNADRKAKAQAFHLAASQRNTYEENPMETGPVVLEGIGTAVYVGDQGRRRVFARTTEAMLLRGEVQEMRAPITTVVRLGEDRYDISSSFKETTKTLDNYTERVQEQLRSQGGII